MRKIEKEMLQAIQSKQNWNKDNTAVYYVQSLHPDGSYSEIYLHGNCLGLYYHNTKTFDMFWYTFRAWPTMTTASRLRALGVGAHIVKGKAYIDGKEV